MSYIRFPRRDERQRAQPLEELAVELDPAARRVESAGAGNRGAANVDPVRGPAVPARFSVRRLFTVETPSKSSPPPSPPSPPKNDVGWFNESNRKRLCGLRVLCGGDLLDK